MLSMFVPTKLPSQHPIEVLVRIDRFWEALPVIFAEYVRTTRHNSQFKCWFDLIVFEKLYMWHFR